MQLICSAGLTKRPLNLSKFQPLEALEIGGCKFQRGHFVSFERPKGKNIERCSGLLGDNIEAGSASLLILNVSCLTFQT